MQTVKEFLAPGVAPLARTKCETGNCKDARLGGDQLCFGHVIGALIRCCRTGISISAARRRGAVLFDPADGGVACQVDPPATARIEDRSGPRLRVDGFDELLHETNPDQLRMPAAE